jgi:hypothetical protein
VARPEYAEAGAVYGRVFAAHAGQTDGRGGHRVRSAESKSQRSTGLDEKAGLQWLYRLIKEPRRLWRRYLTNNAGFEKKAALRS